MNRARVGRGLPLVGLVGVLVPALLGAATAQPADPELDACLARLRLDTLERHGDCVERALQAGRVADLAARLGLGSTPPAVEVTRSEGPRTLVTDRNQADLGFEVVFRAAAGSPALIHLEGLRIQYRIRYTTFGFQWDAGQAECLVESVDLTREDGYPHLVLGPGETCQVKCSPKQAIKRPGVYRIEVTLATEGVVTVPAVAPDAWPARTTFLVMYLPPAGVGDFAGSAKLDLWLDGAFPSCTVGQEISMTLKLRNRGDTALLLPRASSFFGAPFWFVVLSQGRGEVLDHGCFTPLAELEPAEESAQALRSLTLGPRETLSILGRFRPHLPEGDYELVVGYSVAAPLKDPTVLQDDLRIRKAQRLWLESPSR